LTREWNFSSKEKIENIFQKMMLCNSLNLLPLLAEKVLTFPTRKRMIQINLIPVLGGRFVLA
jgi:hypothetical protein